MLVVDDACPSDACPSSATESQATNRSHRIGTGYEADTDIDERVECKAQTLSTPKSILTLWHANPPVVGLAPLACRLARECRYGTDRDIDGEETVIVS